MTSIISSSAQIAPESSSRLPRTASKLGLHLQELNERNTLEYRVQALDDEQKQISLWHDLSLFAPNSTVEQPLLNFICEIPKCTNKKYEIATTEEGTPIKQDEKKGKLREFKKGDIYFNYGCLPRTWEDPAFIHPDLATEGVGGDNDPLDVCEIGLRIIPTGEVRAVKPIGILCMIDDGEADWKVIVIDAEDRWADELNDIEDVERLLPHCLDTVREWFRTYKIPDGKPPNVFGLGEQFMNKEYTLNVIHETHEAWKNLVSGNLGSIPRELSVPSLEKLAGVEADTTMIRNLSGTKLSDMSADLAATTGMDIEGGAAAADDEAPSF